MKNSEELRQQLRSINRKSYLAYKGLKGLYHFGNYILSIDHVQGDPFASPSHVSIQISHRDAGFPGDNLPEMTLESIYKKAENDFQTAKKSELLTKNEEKVFIRTVDFLEKLWIELRGETGSEDKTENNKAVEISEKDTYERAKTAFATEADSLETQTEYISQTLQNVFDFMEAAFGDSQEMVAFITELNANFYSIWFIRENGSDQYYRHNKGLLFDDRQKLILGQMEELENTMKRGLKN